MTFETGDAKEYIGRGYVFWTPLDSLVLNLAYQYEHFEDKEASLVFEEVKTHRLPLGIKWFHPSGLSASLQATYFHQEGQFRTSDFGLTASGKYTFWIVDASLRCRLPKRYGFVSLGVTNLFDENFRYQETDFDNPAIQPDRIVFGQVILSLP
ncbi:hypothetical protein C2W62_10370 [Candidatus Entotheonella serta]|nr:hypothetical protein C2W62_10370 [Candidatus Entotheonella serta]